LPRWPPKTENGKGDRKKKETLRKNEKCAPRGDEKSSKALGEGEKKKVRRNEGDWRRGLNWGGKYRKRKKKGELNEG